MSDEADGGDLRIAERRLEGSGKAVTAGIIDTIAKVLVVGAPVSYALGRAYANGYWSAIGITPTIMARGFEDYVYFSFVMVVNVGIALFNLSDIVGLVAAVGALLLLFITVVIAGLSVPRLMTWLKFKTRFARRRASMWLQRRKALGRAVALGRTTVGTVAVLAFVGFYLLLLLLLPVAIAQKVGAHQAALTISKIANDNSNHERVAAQSGSNRVVGRMLECNARWCVIHTGSEFIAVPENSVEWLFGKDLAPTAEEK